MFKTRKYLLYGSHRISTLLLDILQLRVSMVIYGYSIVFSTMSNSIYRAYSIIDLHAFLSVEFFCKSGLLNEIHPATNHTQNVTHLHRTV